VPGRQTRQGRRDCAPRPTRPTRPSSWPWPARPSSSTCRPCSQSHRPCLLSLSRPSSGRRRADGSRRGSLQRLPVTAAEARRGGGAPRHGRTASPRALPGGQRRASSRIPPTPSQPSPSRPSTPPKSACFVGRLGAYFVRAPAEGAPQFPRAPYARLEKSRAPPRGTVRRGRSAGAGRCEARGCEALTHAQAAAWRCGGARRAAAWRASGRRLRMQPRELWHSRRGHEAAAPCPRAAPPSGRSTPPPRRPREAQRCTGCGPCGAAWSRGAALRRLPRGRPSCRRITGPRASPRARRSVRARARGRRPRHIMCAPARCVRAVRRFALTGCLRRRRHCMFAGPNTRWLSGRCPLLADFARQRVEKYWGRELSDIKWRHLELVHQVLPRWRCLCSRCEPPDTLPPCRAADLSRHVAAKCGPIFPPAQGTRLCPRVRVPPCMQRDDDAGEVGGMLLQQPLH